MPEDFVLELHAVFAEKKKKLMCCFLNVDENAFKELLSASTSSYICIPQHHVPAHHLPVGEFVKTTHKTR